MMRHSIFVTIATALFLTCGFSAQYASAADPPDFNIFITRAINEVVKDRSGGGYDISSVFSKNLKYGTQVIKASNPPKTMCVAAVEEVIIEAMGLFAKENGPAIFEKIPATSWSKGNMTSLRGNIFMFKGTGSRGTGHTLERFKMGKQIPFRQAKAGDFINLNRSSGSGHAVVFLAFLDADAKEVKPFDSRVVGFKYFSAQGMGRPDGGFGFRNAFFGGHCPAARVTDGVERDCKVIKSENSTLLNVGRMFDPSAWEFDDAVVQIRAGVRTAFENAFPGEPRGFVDKLTDLEVNRELEPMDDVENFFNGVTEDSD